MPDDASFPDLMHRLHAGDKLAAEELFGCYGPRVRLEARLGFLHPRLNRLVDEYDLGQSVMLSFFMRARLGEYDLAAPGELMRLLAAQARPHGAARRDFRKAEALAGAEGAAAAGASPNQVVAGEESLHEFRAWLSEEDRRVGGLRAEGRAWAEIAATLGGTPDSRRVQFRRAVARVARELGREAGDE